MGGSLKRLCVIAGALLIAAPSLAQKKELPVDTRASELRWTGHAEVGSYAPGGTLALREGTLRFDAGKFAGARLVVDMNSMQQENSDLLHHLKSGDFFDVEHYPAATIVIDRVAAGVAYGSLTVRGKTTPLEVSVKVTQAGDRFTVTGKVSLDRTKYGIVYNSTSFFSGLGNKAIRNDFDVEFRVSGTGVIPEGLR